MRYGWVLMLLALALAPAWAVEYAPGSAIALGAQVSAFSVAPGGRVRISLSASDTDYRMGPNNTILEQVPETVTISYEVTDGTVQKLSTGSNPLDLSWQVPITPGHYAMYVTADDAGRLADDPAVRYLIEVEAANAGSTATKAPDVRVAANPQTICLDRTKSSTITAQVLGNKDLAGKTVRFFTTRGTLSATTATTDANGVATVRLNAGRFDVGTAMVAASYGATTATSTVEIVDRQPTPVPFPDNPTPPAPPIPPFGSSAFVVGIDPNTLPADGKSSAVVTVRIADLRGVGIPRKLVTFATTMGGIAPRASMTDLNGYARTALIAPTVPGTALVTAEVEGGKGYATINFTGQQAQQTPQGPPRLFLTIDPTTVMADGRTRIRVEALVLDSEGHAIPDTPVQFSASMGALAQSTVNTDAGGKAVTSITAADRPGLATVTARLGQLTAASQVAFQGVATDNTPALDLRLWNGQQSNFVNERWLLRTVQVENGTGGGVTQMLSLIDDAGRAAREVPLGRSGVIIYDQYGAAQGYGIEGNNRAFLTLLKPDGSEARTVTINLLEGSHLQEVVCAQPSGNLLVTMSQPDGTRPEVQYFNSQGAPVLVLRDGLESMPATAVSGDGYLVVALIGGTTRLVSPTGLTVSEARRTDGLQPVCAAVADGGIWYAVGAALAGQTQVKPTVSVYSRQGTPQISFDQQALQLTPLDGGTLLIGTPDRTACVTLADGRVRWSLAGTYEKALRVNNSVVVAGQRDPQTRELRSTILVLRLNDGAALANQRLNDLRAIYAVLPPNDKGMVGVVTAAYTFRFPLPKEN